MIIAVSLGTVIGAISGFFGGKTDQLTMRVTDLFLSLPVLPVLLLTVYLFREPVTKALGQEMGIFVIVVVMIGTLAWMSTARIVRATFLSLKHKDFVEAATGIGVSRTRSCFAIFSPMRSAPSSWRQRWKWALPSSPSRPCLSWASAFPPDTPTWGRLVTDGAQFLQAAPWLALIPAALIFLTVISINFVGDGLRDALDPCQRR